MWIEQPLEARRRRQEGRAVALQQPVRHAPAARGADQAPPGDVGDVEVEDRDRHRRRRARHRRRRVRRGGGDGWRRHVEGGDDHEADHDDDRGDHDVPPTTAPPIPIATAHRAARPVGREPHPPALVGEDREHARRRDRRPASTRPTSSTKRWSRATSPASSPSSTRPCPDDRRPGPVGAARGPRHRLADRWHLRLLGRRRRSPSKRSTPRRCTRSTTAPRTPTA